MPHRFIVTPLLLLFALVPIANGDDIIQIEFDKDVRPIFQARCESCHGSQERESGLQFLSRSDLFLRNDSGEPAVIAGDPDHSELIRRITSEDEFERMPPEGRALSEQEIETLKLWIKQGAVWPETDSPRKHWAYVKPQRPEVPHVSGQGRITNAIDSFVLQQLTEQAISPRQAPQADPATLIRRVYFDLIGLPPTPDQVHAFEQNPSFEHYVEIVDRLLASPQYGQKWTMQWLDLARYADSNGFQADQFREIWAYRDWVVNAFNNDMPFDLFTIAQMAGDLLPDSTLSEKIATGFHRCTTCNVEAGVDPEENRVNQILNRVNTTGTVWLGTTLECAQCHNHKYDPFSQQDYYQIFAYFNNTPLEVIQPNGTGVQFEVSGPKMALPLDDTQATQLAELTERKEALNKKIDRQKKVISKQQEQWEAELKQRLTATPEWHVLTPQSFQSKGGAGHEVLEDESILLTGKAPDKDLYTATFRTDIQEITGFKLETLTDETLPGTGPGRGDPDRPNFVAHELELTIASGSSENAEKVLLHSAQADFSQNNFDVSNLIDGDIKTAWAINPQFGKPHWASFLTEKPIGNAAGTTLTLTIDQHFGKARTIGRLRFLAMTGDPGAESIPQEIRDILASDQKRTQKQNRQLTEYHQSADPHLSKLTDQLKKLDAQIDAVQPLTTLVMVEMETPRDTNIFTRGNFLSPGAKVEPTVPAILHPLDDANTEDETPERLKFARWLVSEENPLVARVTVNRWWAELFGRGIVETVEDFGSQGASPSHAQLLDWLAVEFMQNNWSMKHIHRLIVLSETYRQDSKISAQSLEADPQNKWYARGPRFRMPAEVIRDNALAVSGLISLKAGGPPIYPPQPENIWRHVGRNAPKYDTDTNEDRYRRGLYVVWRRSAPYPSFVNFDAPDRASCVVKRSRTNTPLQALTLLNDPAYVEMAHALARRLVADLPDADADERIDYAFRLVLSRSPNSHEREYLSAFFHAERDRFQEHPKSAEEVVPDSERIDEIALSDQAAYFEISNILLNLDEAITKN